MLKRMMAENISYPEMAKKLKRTIGAINAIRQQMIDSTGTLAGEISTYVDESGQRITRVPPGYARGYYPQPNIKQVS